MAPPSDDQTKKQVDDMDKTVILVRCDKHGITYLQTEECPECAKEKNDSSQNKSD